MYVHRERGLSLSAFRWMVPREQGPPGIPIWFYGSDSINVLLPSPSHPSLILGRKETRTSYCFVPKLIVVYKFQERRKVGIRDVLVHCSCNGSVAASPFSRHPNLIWEERSWRIAQGRRVCAANQKVHGLNLATATTSLGSLSLSLSPPPSAKWG